MTLAAIGAASAAGLKATQLARRADLTLAVSIVVVLQLANLVAVPLWAGAVVSGASISASSILGNLRVRFRVRGARGRWSGPGQLRGEQRGVARTVTRPNLEGGARSPGHTPTVNDPSSFTGRAAQQRGDHELALRQPLTWAGAIATGHPLSQPGRRLWRPTRPPAEEVAAGPPMLHHEHLSLPKLDDGQRKRQWRSCERHEPIPPARQRRQRRVYPRHIRGYRPELDGDVHRLAEARRLERKAQARAILIRERRARQATQWAH
jgi:hypothetical protein